MTTLRDLVIEVCDAHVVEAVARLYEQHQTEWLFEAITDVLAELRQLNSDAADTEHELHIDLAPPIDPEDQPFWDVCCTKENDPQRYGLDLSRWEEWLAIHVPESLLDKMSATDVVAHCVWEMTFYGFTQEKIAETRAELERRVKEIDEGKPELIPWEEVKAQLDAGFERGEDEESSVD